LFPAPITLKKYLGELKPCIICNSENLESWAKLDYLEAKKCRECGMISVNPHLTNEGLSKLYEGYFFSRLEQKEMSEKRKISHKLDFDWITKFINHGKVLDVGCSGGQFLSFFDPKKWERQGVEIDKDTALIAKTEYNIPVKIGYFPEISFEDKFDLIIIRGVIEHFSDPISVLKKCAEVLKPNGYLFISATPVGNSFAFHVYREKWVHFTPLSHIHFFTVDLLTRMLKNFNMSLIDQHYPYEETPYANPEKDFTKIENDIILISQGKQDQISSTPFFGSVMTAVWQKNS
jgi:2-polyprenyl-3-methyl-5-hydroxy-6-metoxy-1,4-benzoquinol methylase